jgi:DNA-binding IscR family transcriptional regulator
MRAPSEISALEIVEAIDGPLDTDICLLDTLAECNGKNPCPLHNVILSIRETTKQKLLEHSLADLARDWTEWRDVFASAYAEQGGIES